MDEEVFCTCVDTAVVVALSSNKGNPVGRSAIYFAAGGNCLEYVPMASEASCFS